MQAEKVESLATRKRGKKEKCMIRNLWNRLPGWLRKLIPALVVLTLVIVGGNSTVLSEQFHQFVTVTLKERVKGLVPIASDLLIGGTLLYIAWLLSPQLMKYAKKALDRTHASDRGKSLFMRGVQLAYWVIVVSSVLSMFAADLMGKMVLGATVLTAALTLAMQGAANDFISGLMMQFTQRLRPGDEVKVIGIAEVEGKIVDVGYLSTVVETADGVLSVPNRKIWESPLKVKKPAPPPPPPPSKLILPPGYDACRKEKT